MTDATLKIYDPSLDEMRAATQADIDLLWSVSQAYGALKDILRDVSKDSVPINERVVQLRDYRRKANG